MQHSSLGRVLIILLLVAIPVGIYLTRPIWSPPPPAPTPRPTVATTVRSTPTPRPTAAPTRPRPTATVPPMRTAQPLAQATGVPPAPTATPRIEQLGVQIHWPDGAEPSTYAVDLQSDPEHRPVGGLAVPTSATWSYYVYRGPRLSLNETLRKDLTGQGWTLVAATAGGDPKDAEPGSLRTAIHFSRVDGTQLKIFIIELTKDDPEYQDVAVAVVPPPTPTPIGRR